MASSPDSLRVELVALGSRAQFSKLIDDDAGPTDEQIAAIADVVDVAAETWFALANWAKRTGNLQGWQRSIAFGIGRRVSQGTPASPKQAVQGAKILQEARRLGFDG